MKNSRLVLFAGSLLATSALLAQGENTSTQPSNQQQSNQQQTQNTPSGATQQSGDRQQSTSGTTSGQTSGATGSTSSSQMDSQSQSGTTQQEPRRTAAADQSKAGQKTGSSPVVMLFVPVAMQQQTNNTLANGCWARLYGENNFGGDSLTLVGPVEMQNMTGPFGMDWGEKVSSVQAGPRATVVMYDNEQFKDKSATVKPKQQLGEISEKMGLFEEVNSMRITCSPAAG